jgi:hypothetical protein
MHSFWRGTRIEFESDPTWRATIQRHGKVTFVLERSPGQYFEYREGQRLFGTEGLPVEISELKDEEEKGLLNIMAGRLKS